MAKIITTSELQKTIGKLLFYVKQSWVVVTKKGKPTVVVLPYFDDNEDAVAEYLEDYEMHEKRAALQKRYEESRASGASGLAL